MHVVVARRWASEPARSSRRRAIATTFVRSVLARACGAAPGCASRCGRGSAERCCSGVSLVAVGIRAVTPAARVRIAARLVDAARARGAVRGHRGRRHALEVARPALQQLASALRSRADVEPRGVAITQILLTEPSSALYRPAYREELYEFARAALFALGSRVAAARGGCDDDPGRGSPPRTRRTLNEAAHKLEVKAGEDIAAGGLTGRPPVRKRTFNEAAHKLGYWAPPTPDSREIESEAARKRFEALADYDRDVITHAGRAVLVLGALGVVYGDVGTSPLYTEQVIFGSYHATAHVTPAVAYGIVSLIFWALTIIVSIKYAGFIMRAHNRGDGGIMALTALLHRNRVAHAGALVTLGIFGARRCSSATRYHAAISVLSSLQGLEVAQPGLSHLLVPLSVADPDRPVRPAVITRSGTIGWVSGGVIIVWFVAIGLIGLNEVLKDPAVLQGLSPTWAARFLIDHDGASGYLVLGGVVLAVTRAERCTPTWDTSARPDPAGFFAAHVSGPDAELPRPGRDDPAPVRAPPRTRSFCWHRPGLSTRCWSSPRRPRSSPPRPRSRGPFRVAQPVDSGSSRG